LTLDNDSIIAWLDSLEKESKALKKEVLQLCWYMRGSVSYSEAMEMSPSEREIIVKIVKDNLETAKKSGMPFF
jgi:hypothetical protein